MSMSILAMILRSIVMSNGLSLNSNVNTAVARYAQNLPIIATIQHTDFFAGFKN